MIIFADSPRTGIASDGGRAADHSNPEEDLRDLQAADPGQAHGIVGHSVNLCRACDIPIFDLISFFFDR